MTPEEREKEYEKLRQAGIKGEQNKPKATKKTQTSKQKRGPVVLYDRMSEIKRRPIDWLWPGRIACGKVTLIAGDPGLGKSQITAALAGIVTTGGKWPVDNALCTKGAVIFLSAEDDASDTINPRLEAVGADLAQCIKINATQEYDETGSIRRRGFSLKNDLPKLEYVINEVGNVRLIVVDPITAYLGGIDSHKNADVRELLTPLSEFAEKHKLAVLGISHLNKSTTQDAISRVSGSGAFVAASRAAFFVVKDRANSDRRLLLPLKNNLAKDIDGFAFGIQSVTLDDGIQTSKAVFENELVAITADEAMTAKAISSTDKRALEDAERFLLELLSNGPVEVKAIENEAEKAGYSWATIRRAKGGMPINSKKGGFDGSWFWSISEDAQSEDAQTPYKTLSTFGGGREIQGLHEDSHPQNEKTLSAFGGGREIQGLKPYLPNEDAQRFDMSTFEKFLVDT